MSWNYRVMRYKDKSIGVHEVYYDDRLNITGWTKDPIIVGDDIDELLHTLNMIKEDVERSRYHIMDYEKMSKEV